MTARNILLILADEHTRWASGCYGAAEVKTPSLDALAGRGTRFSRAYTPTPICVPARACIATGRYAHEIGAWDNGRPYVGTEAPSWGHVLTAHGKHITTIGKLHYRNTSDRTGFNDQRIPLHVHEGVGDTLGLLRGKMPVERENRPLILQAGPGESEYTRYDRAIARAARGWLHEEAPMHTQGWVLVVSFCSPHLPLVAPTQFFRLYDPDELELPVASSPNRWPRHPALERHRVLQAHDEPLAEMELRTAVAAYLGLVSFADSLVGDLLATLEEVGQDQTTTVVYTSDHGEMLGAHGLWWKSCMYEGAVGVPLLIAGPDIPSGSVCDTNVSLVDLFPTLLEIMEAEQYCDPELRGESVLSLLRQGSRTRTVFSEYHANYSAAAIYMIADDDYKYVEYVGEPPQLFDRTSDPTEIADLAQHPSMTSTLASYADRLRRFVDPIAVDHAAKTDQQDRVAQLGGVAAVLERGELAYSPAPHVP